LFLLGTIVVVIVVISLFLYCIFNSYSSIQLSSRKCVKNLSVQCVLSYVLTSELACPCVVQTAVCLRRLSRTQLRYFNNTTAAFHWPVSKDSCGS